MGVALEAQGEALYLAREYAAAATCYERAYIAYRRERQFLAAGRAARTVSWISGNVLGDWAVQSGWLGRARSVLADVGEDSPEHGWALILQAFAEPEPDARRSCCATRSRSGAGSAIPMSSSRRWCASAECSS